MVSGGSLQLLLAASLLVLLFSHGADARRLTARRQVGASGGTGTGTNATAASQTSAAAAGAPTRAAPDPVRAWSSSLPSPLAPPSPSDYTSYATQSAGGPSPVVSTDCGNVRGREEDGVFWFRGIPYAAPPLGPRRWRPSVSLKEANMCWTADPLEVKEHRSVCAQLDPSSQSLVGSEDCLSLTVAVPATARPVMEAEDAMLKAPPPPPHVNPFDGADPFNPKQDTTKRLPVLVFLHGGNGVGWAGTAPPFTPSAAAVKSLNALFVSVNYRLGALGFLALDVLTAESTPKASGNYGLYDQLLALKWIQRNIIRFGGDTRRVTLLGHGFGATAALALLTSPLAQDLFQGAVALSPSPFFPLGGLAAATQANLAFVSRSRCSNDTTPACLRSLTTDEVLAASPLHDTLHWANDLMFDLPATDATVSPLIVVDGVVIPEHPVLAFAKGAFNAVPLLVSNVAQECDAFVRDLFLNPEIPDQVFHQSMVQRFDAFLKNVPKSKKYYNSYRGIFQLKNDRQFLIGATASDMKAICSTNALVTLIAAQKAYNELRVPIYRLVVEQPPAMPFPALFKGGVKPRFAFHMWDLFSLLDTARQFTSPGLSDVALSSLLNSFVRTFASTYVLPWPTAQNSFVAVVNGGPILHGGKQYHQDQCAMLPVKDLTRVGWTN